MELERLERIAAEISVNDDDSKHEAIETEVVAADPEETLNEAFMLERDGACGLMVD